MKNSLTRHGLAALAVASAAAITLTPATALAAPSPDGTASDQAILKEIESNLVDAASKSYEGKAELKTWRSMSKDKKQELVKIVTDSRVPEAVEAAANGNQTKLKQISKGLDFSEASEPSFSTRAVGTNSAVQSNKLTYFGLSLTTLRTHVKYQVSRGGTAYKIDSCYNSHTNILPLRSVSGSNSTWGPKNHLSCQTTWIINYGVPKVPGGTYTVEQGLTVSGGGVVNRWCTNGF